MKSSISVFTLLSVLLLTSCEGETSYTRKVENNSKYPVTIQFEYGSESEPRSIEVAPNNNEIVLWTSKLGADNTAASCTGDMDDVQVILEDGLVLNKDIREDSEWDHDSESSGMFDQIVRQTCCFVISDEDFE